jgi:hypothetical protein
MKTKKTPTRARLHLSSSTCTNSHHPTACSLPPNCVLAATHLPFGHPTARRAAPLIPPPSSSITPFPHSLHHEIPRRPDRETHRSAHRTATDLFTSVVDHPVAPSSQSPICCPTPAPTGPAARRPSLLPNVAAASSQAITASGCLLLSSHPSGRCLLSVSAPPAATGYRSRPLLLPTAVGWPSTSSTELILLSAPARPPLPDSRRRPPPS